MDLQKFLDKMAKVSSDVGRIGGNVEELRALQSKGCLTYDIHSGQQVPVAERGPSRGPIVGDVAGILLRGYSHRTSALRGRGGWS